jgi:hypothetical protein
MSSLSLTIKTLLAGTEVTDLVEQRIYPVQAPQDAGYPNIVVYRTSEDEEELLAGASQYPEARISVECRASGSNPDADADRLGEAVVAWLRDKVRYAIGGCAVEFRRQGSDETIPSRQARDGIPVVSRRIIDFYVRWRDVS